MRFGISTRIAAMPIEVQQQEVVERLGGSTRHAAASGETLPDHFAQGARAGRCGDRNGEQLEFSPTIRHAHTVDFQFAEQRLEATRG